MIIRRITVMSLARIMGVLYAVIGLLIGGIFALASFFGAAIGSATSGSEEPWIGVVFGLGALVIAPLFYGVLGFIGGLIGAAIYNAVAGAVGGIEVELVDS